MTKIKYTPGPEADPPAPEDFTVIEEDLTPEEIAETNAAADRDLLAKLEARDGEYTPPAPATEEEIEDRLTIGDQFLRIAELLAKAKSKYRLSEATLIKAWELNLMWILNQQQAAERASHSQPPFDFPVGEPDLPTPNEVIEGSNKPEETV